MSQVIFTVPLLWCAKSICLEFLKCQLKFYSGLKFLAILKLETELQSHSLFTQGVYLVLGTNYLLLRTSYYDIRSVNKRISSIQNGVAAVDCGNDKPISCKLRALGEIYPAEVSKITSRVAPDAPQQCPTKLCNSI